VSDLSPRPSRTPRRARERRAYQLVLAGGTAAAVAVIGFVLAIVGVIGLGIRSWPRSSRWSASSCFAGPPAAERDYLVPWSLSVRSGASSAAVETSLDPSAPGAAPRPSDGRWSMPLPRRV